MYFALIRRDPPPATTTISSSVGKPVNRVLVSARLVPLPDKPTDKPFRLVALRPSPVTNRSASATLKPKVVAEAPPAVPEPAPAVVEKEPEVVVEAAVEMVVDEAPAAVALSAVEEPGVLNLGESLVISTVGKTRAEWMDRVMGGVDSPITLDGSDIQVIDTAGLQLVMALIRELNEDGVSWQWGDRSDLLNESAQQLGLSSQLSL